MTDRQILDLLERTLPMTAAEREEQRRSFAYGNAAIANGHVTREAIDRAAEELARATPRP